MGLAPTRGSDGGAWPEFPAGRLPRSVPLYASERAAALKKPRGNEPLANRRLRRSVLCLTRHHVCVPTIGVTVEEEQPQLVVLIAVHIEGPRVCRWRIRSRGVSSGHRGTALHSGPRCQRKSDDLSALLVIQLPGSRAGEAPAVLEVEVLPVELFEESRSVFAKHHAGSLDVLPAPSNFGRRGVVDPRPPVVLIGASARRQSNQTHDQATEGSPPRTQPASARHQAPHSLPVSANRGVGLGEIPFQTS